MKRWLRWFYCVALAGLFLCGCSGRRGPGPLKPQEALKSFQLNEDFRIELFAAEPYVVDPVEVVFDEAGRAFAAEMRDLPYDPPPGKPPRSRIRLLEDTDGDGRVDRATIFADKLLQVTSMLPWKGGLIVAAAPDILYLKDTDGDGRADVRQVLFTGFALVNPESRITNLRFGIDNWIYAANSGQPGNIRFTERPEIPPVSVSGADIRFRLDRGLFEAESGPTQFGLTMDDWGHRFITQNTIHVRNVVIPRRYLNRNPFLPAGEAAQDISDHGQPAVPIFPLTKPQYWREVRTKMRQQRYQETSPGRVEHVGGYFTAAAGGTVYCGDGFPEKYRGNLFTGDVSANLVHRDILRPEGATFVASRAPEEQSREFLASTDPWFRPCNFTTGPDGNLYVVDMYREFIETPESIPEELKKDIDFYSGDTLGRVYRIVPKNAPPSKRVQPDLGQAESAELVRHLSHPNGWWRSTAQRLLLERQDKTIIPLLKKMAVESDSPQARLHAIYLLEGMSSLDARLVGAALNDVHPGVREHAVRLAESFPDLVGMLAGVVQDSSPHVQFQLALSLGEFSDETALKALASLASNHAQDRWFRAAILSSPPGSSMRLLESMLQEKAFFLEFNEGKAQFLEGLAAVLGARHAPQEITRFIKLMSSTRVLNTETWQVPGLRGLARGLKLAGASRLKIPSAEILLGRALASPSEKIQAAARAAAKYFELRTLISSASKEALNPSLPSHKREMAIYSLGSGSFDEVRPVFEKLLSSPLDQPLLKTTIQSLSSFEQPEISGLLIARWKSFGPGVRNDVLDVLLNHRQRVPELLKAIEDGRIEPGALDLARREKLRRNPDPNISHRASQLFHEEQSDHAKVLEAYRGVLNQRGDAVKGKVVFEKNCAKCHLPQRGYRVGPDLSGVNSNTKAQLLQSILDPSKVIEPRFTNYIVITKDERIHDGLIVAETPGTLTLRRAEAEDETILRSNTAEIRASSVSLMPDGFEKSISQSEMADLIAFLQGANLHQNH